MESSEQVSAVNNNSETWTPGAIEAVKERVVEGLQWWSSALQQITNRHVLDFQIDYTHADSPVVTAYEPIKNPSTAFNDWIYDFFRAVDYDLTGDFSADIRAFNDAQRERYATDWAFTIFVVNDQHDDGMFEPGGFRQAFAFSGGRFFVMPASRPASTVAHETGHMFWALDEYMYGGTYTSTRGYYNTQNSNAWDNPAFRDPSSGEQQQPSIMASGGNPGDLLYTAYVSNTSSQSSLEMIGWRDSDGDGVFDVLDVPLSLTGSGYFDSAHSVYWFRGESAVQAFVNRNSSGNQNDISINRVGRLEYRFDAAGWQVAEEYDAFAVDIDVKIPFPASAESVEIRTVDSTTGVSSPVFVGRRDHATSALDIGIQGFVFSDLNGDGDWGTTERGLAGITVQLVDSDGEMLVLQNYVEPDEFPMDSVLLNDVHDDVMLTAVGAGVADTTVRSLADTRSGGFGRLFGNNSVEYGCQGACTLWTSSTRQLRVDFRDAVSSVTLDALADTDGDFGRLEAYDSQGRMVARYTTQSLARGSRESMAVVCESDEIAYVVARGHMDTAVMFDGLRFGPQPTTVTDSLGHFAFPHLAAGDYRVAIRPESGLKVTSPDGTTTSVHVAVGQRLETADFGVTGETSRWQNPNNAMDVNADGWVTSGDALLIINSLNAIGPRGLTDSDPTPPFLDTSGDRSVSPLDVLLVINHVNRNPVAGLRSTVTGGRDSTVGLGAVEGESGAEVGTTGMTHLGISSDFDATRLAFVADVWAAVGLNRCDRFADLGSDSSKWVGLPAESWPRPIETAPDRSDGLSARDAVLGERMDWLLDDAKGCTASIDPFRDWMCWRLQPDVA